MVDQRPSLAGDARYEPVSTPHPLASSAESGTEHDVTMTLWSASETEELRSLAPRLPESIAFGEIRRRLLLVGWGLAGICCGLFIFEYAAAFFEGVPRHLELVALAAMTLLGGTLALAAGRPWLRDVHLLGIGAVHLLAICGLSGLLHGAHELRQYGHLTPFGPYILVIGLFPLVLPYPVPRTVILAIGATLSALLGLAGAVAVLAESSEALSPDLYFGLMLGLVIAVIMSLNVKRLRDRMDAIRHLGSYRLEGKLGEGGMGEVWRGTHHLLARPTAIKLVRPRHLRGLPEEREKVLERFTREARATASLGSMHTIDLYDFGIGEDDTFFIAMELLDGIDLSALVRRFGRQPASRVRRILLQACDSLAEAHDKGLIHRDIKPTNLMLCRKGRKLDVVKVLDFGIVALPPQARDGVLTSTGAVLGTPAFLPPEAFTNAAPDPRSDLYALGCVAYWLLTGHRVFEYPSQAQVIAAHQQEAPIPPSERGVGVPRKLEAIVLRCLEKDPARRFDGADALASELERCRVPDEWTPARARQWWKRHLPTVPSDGTTPDVSFSDYVTDVTKVG